MHGAVTVAGGEDAGSRQRRPAGQEQSSNRGGVHGEERWPRQGQGRGEARTTTNWRRTAAPASVEGHGHREQGRHGDRARALLSCAMRVCGGGVGGREGEIERRGSGLWLTGHRLGYGWALEAGRRRLDGLVAASVQKANLLAISHLQKNRIDRRKMEGKK